MEWDYTGSQPIVMPYLSTITYVIKLSYTVNRGPCGVVVKSTAFETGVTGWSPARVEDTDLR